MVCRTSFFCPFYGDATVLSKIIFNDYIIYYIIYLLHVCKLCVQVNCYIKCGFSFFQQREFLFFKEGLIRLSNYKCMFQCTVAADINS